LDASLWDESVVVDALLIAGGEAVAVAVDGGEELLEGA